MTAAYAPLCLARILPFSSPVPALSQPCSRRPRAGAAAVYLLVARSGHTLRGPISGS